MKNQEKRPNKRIKMKYPKCTRCGKKSIKLAYFHKKEVCSRCFRILKWEDQQLAKENIKENGK